MALLYKYGWLIEIPIYFERTIQYYELIAIFGQYTRSKGTKWTMKRNNEVRVFYDNIVQERWRDILHNTGYFFFMVLFGESNNSFPSKNRNSAFTVKSYSHRSLAYEFYTRWVAGDCKSQRTEFINRRPTLIGIRILNPVCVFSTAKLRARSFN